MSMSTHEARFFLGLWQYHLSIFTILKNIYVYVNINAHMLSHIILPLHHCDFKSFNLERKISWFPFIIVMSKLPFAFLLSLLYLEYICLKNIILTLLQMNIIHSKEMLLLFGCCCPHYFAFPVFPWCRSV